MKKGLWTIGFLFLAACDAEPKLEDYTYQLVTEGRPVVTLSFDEPSGRYFGKVVNAYYGSYQKSGTTLTFGAPSSDMMMGSAEAMQVETDYLDALHHVQNYTLTADTLVLTGTNDVRLILKKQPLE